MQAVLQALANGATVVTSRPAQARHLQQHFDREQRRVGRSAWRTPDVLHLSPWLERLWEEASLSGSAVGEYQLLRRQHAHQVWQDIIARSTSLLDPDAAATLAQRAWTLAQDWGISSDDIRAQAITDDTRLFTEWCDAYIARCAEQGWLDAACLPRLLDPSFATAGSVYLYGFAHLTPQVHRLSERFGLRHLAPPSYPGSAPTDIAYRACADEAVELDAAADWLWEQRQSLHGGIVGLVLANPVMQLTDVRRRLLHRLQPNWHRVAAPLQVVDAENATKLAACGPVRTALLALRLPSGLMDYDEFGALLRSPFLADAEQEASERAVLDIRLREKNHRSINLDWVRTDPDLGAPAGMVKMLQTARDWATRFGGQQAPSRWLTLIDRYLKALGWCRGPDTDEQIVVHGWRRLLEQFAASGLVSGPVTFSTARRYLARAAADEPLRVTGPPDSVRLLPLADAFGFSFDAVWIAGLSRDNWPSPVLPDVLIPLELQRRCGIPAANPATHQAQSDAQLKSVLGSSDSVAASWPRQANEIGQSPHEALSARCVDAKDQPTRSVPTRRAAQLERLGTEALDGDRPPGLSANEKVRGGSKLFRFQAACPARGFFELRLGATEMPVPAFGIDARTRGVFMHAALEKLYAALKTAGALDTLATTEVERLVEQAIDDASRRYLAGSDALSTLLAAQERNRMHELIRGLLDIERTRPFFAPASLEAEELVSIGPLTVRIRQDRIDRLGDRRTLVFDYKTGRSFTDADWLGSRPVEPQLPLYAVTGGADGIGVILMNACGVEFIGVARPGCGFGGIVEADSGSFHTDWDRLVDDWRAALTRLAEEFAAGDCRIDMNDTRLAAKEFAMLTRIGDIL